VNVEGSSPFARAGRARENSHLAMPRRVADLASVPVPSPVPSLLGVITMLPRKGVRGMANDSRDVAIPKAAEVC
jgi:hypothetical protein